MGPQVNFCANLWDKEIHKSFLLNVRHYLFVHIILTKDSRPDQENMQIKLYLFGTLMAWDTAGLRLLLSPLYARRTPASS